VLAANSPGTKRDGGTCGRTRALAKLSTIDVIEAAITIIGSVDTASGRARYSASRTAREAMNWAVTTPQHAMAVVTA
jgi:hypothetical protein